MNLDVNLDIVPNNDGLIIMFLTKLEDFSYKPYILRGKIQRGLVVLESDLGWYDDEYKQRYTVPKGFVCDLMSRPWWTAFALKKLGRHQRADVLHDWFYINKTNSKSWADLQFRLAMDEDNTRGWRKWTAWSGVAIGGWYSWWSKSDIIIITDIPEINLT